MRCQQVASPWAGWCHRFWRDWHQPYTNQPHNRWTQHSNVTWKNEWCPGHWVVHGWWGLAQNSWLECWWVYQEWCAQRNCPVKEESSSPCSAASDPNRTTILGRVRPSSRLLHCSNSRSPAVSPSSSGMHEACVPSWWSVMAASLNRLHSSGTNMLTWVFFLWFQSAGQPKVHGWEACCFRLEWDFMVQKWRPGGLMHRMMQFHLHWRCCAACSQVFWWSLGLGLTPCQLSQEWLKQLHHGVSFPSNQFSSCIESTNPH